MKTYFITDVNTYDVSEKDNLKEAIISFYSEENIFIGDELVKRIVIGNQIIRQAKLTDKEVVF